MSASTLQSLTAEIAKAFLPLRGALSDKEEASDFLNLLGWLLPPGIDDIGLTGIDIEELVTASTKLSTSVEVEGSTVKVGLYAEMLLAVQKLLNRINELANTLPAKLAASGDYLAKTQIDKLLARRILDLLLLQYLMQRLPWLFELFSFFGIFQLEAYEADPAIYQSKHVRYIIAYDRISLLFSDPRKLLVNLYQWGTPNFDVAVLLIYFGQLLQSLGADAKLRLMPRRVEERLTGTAVPLADIDPNQQLIVSLQQGLGNTTLDVGLSLFRLRATSIGGKDVGIAITPFVKGSSDFKFQLSNNVYFEIESAAELQSGVVLSIRPNRPISLQTGVITGGAIGNPAAGLLGMRIRYRRADNRTIPLVIISGGSRLEFQQFYASIGAGMLAGNKFDLFVEVGLLQGRFVLSTSQSDGFLSKILPGDGIKVDFDLIAGWSSSQGIYFQGSSTLEVRLPVHVDLGPISVKNLYLAIPIGGGQKIPLELSSEITAKLGPLSATIDRLGFTANFDFPSNNNGNLGPLNVALGFKPPSGAGLSIDAGAVKGGGSLFFYPEREEYAGTLELVISGFLTLKAIGLITTKMPDGSKGFSLLIIITAEFGTGIQLGFGFTLLAVGGLIGLNRTMRLQPLAEGIRTGAINSILFPKDVIANAPRIISDLRTIFPPEEGKFLIGPMAKLGWGTPTLISLSLGVIIEIPGNIAILGVLKVALPTVEAPLLVLQVNFIGAIEFDKKRIWFFASLFESRFLFMTLEGEMGLLVAFGDDANFVVSVGGFHPQFNPPPLPFPNPARIAVNIINESNARIRVMNYFAVTSNSAQIGAHSELFFGFGGFSVEGHMGFDALIQFSPFHFIIEVSASVALKAFGVGVFSISLRFSLEGTSPWRARGTGSISLFFFDISADFDITWGEERNTTLPPIEVMPILKAEFEKIDNWSALLPASNNLLVSLRKLETAADTLVLHPVGVLKISQKAIPLDLPIDKVGNQKSSDAKKLRVAVTSTGLGKKSDAQEQFAIAQFQNMEDASKLSRPAYESQHGGLELSVAGQQLASSRMVKRVIRYEEIIIDNNFKRFVRHFSIFVGALFNHFMTGASISKSSLSQSYLEKLQPFEAKIAVQPASYAVAFQATNKSIGTTATFTSQASANDYLQQQIAIDPNMSDALHVIPTHEVSV